MKKLTLFLFSVLLCISLLPSRVCAAEKPNLCHPFVSIESLNPKEPDSPEQSEEPPLLSVNSGEIPEEDDNYQFS